MREALAYCGTAYTCVGAEGGTRSRRPSFLALARLGPEFHHHRVGVGRPRGRPGSLGFGGRQRQGEGDERRGTHSRPATSERDRVSCPDLRKFRIIAVRGDGPVLLIGVPQCWFECPTGQTDLCQRPWGRSG